MCGLSVSTKHKYWYVHLSEMIQALCRETRSFSHLLEGCRRAKCAILEPSQTKNFDFFDGDLFRRKYGSLMKEWDEDTHIIVFLRCHPMDPKSSKNVERERLPGR